jgi:hypothetical protein
VDTPTGASAFDRTYFFFQYHLQLESNISIMPQAMDSLNHELLQRNGSGNAVG